MKVLGYIIGAIFIVLLLSPIGVSCWLVYDRATVLLTTSTEQAVIQECHYKRRKTGSGYSGSWGPVAVTSDGIRIKGSFTWKRKGWCESGIGKEVPVFLHDTDTSKNRINTFFQFWFYPLFFTTVCLIFYPLSYKAKKNKQKKS